MSGYQNMMDNPTGGDKEEEQPQWKRYLNICTLVLGAVVGFVMLIVSIVAYTQLSGYVNDYDAVVHSWEATPVTGLSFVSSTTACSEAVMSSWPGLYPACDCTVPGHTGNSTSSATAACTTQQLADHCVTLQSAAPPVTLYLFPLTIMCVTRGGINSLERPSDPNDCGSAYRVCGQVNTTSGFCWPTSAGACPITDFVLDTTQYTQAQAGADDAPVIAYSGGGTTWWLYVKRGGVLNPLWANRQAGAFAPTGLPLTTVEFNPSDPCFLSGCGYSGRAAEFAADARDYHSNPATSQFGYTQRPLPCDGGCQTPQGSSVSPNGRDLRYSRTNFAISEHTLYTQSGGIPSEYIPSATAPYTWYLQYRTEIEWTQQCAENRNDVVHRQSDVAHVRTAQVVLLIFGIISFIFLSLYFPCVEVCGKPALKERMKKPNLCCKIVVKVTTITATIVCAVIAYGTLSFWNAINKGSVCSDALTDETFQSLGHKFDDLSYNNAINTAASGATGLADLAVAALNRFT